MWRIVFATALAVTAYGAEAGAPPLTLRCNGENDLFRVLTASGYACQRVDSNREAVERAAEGGAVLILADGYPGATTVIEPSVLEEAARKKLRLYLEYPAALPGVEIGAPKAARWERAVVNSDFFGPSLDRLRILAINGLHFVPAKSEAAHVVAARVAGFDTAVYGLPKDTTPILFELSGGRVLVATTKLSNFITGRYAPQDAWQALWAGVLAWLCPDTERPALVWKATVHPSYGRDEPLPADAELQAVRRGAGWYHRSELLLHPSRLDEVNQAAQKDGLVPTPPPDAPEGDGTLGILEAPLSIVLPDGSQMQSVSRRGDCHGESAMALTFGARLGAGASDTEIARNLLNYYLFTSDARKKERGDPQHGAYGLIAWGTGSTAWSVANYGDDNARLLMSAAATAALLGDHRWDEAMTKCLLANLRTTGRRGFRGDRIDIPALSSQGWEPFFRRSIVSYSPHMEAYLWACYLWAYQLTGYELSYERAENALRMTMKQYPNGWRWTNGLAQEKARILLPLAWLVRVKDTPEHRAWLRTAVDGLMALQEPCGAIREQLGIPGRGMFPPPSSNEQYGGSEASLIQRNGDPVSDLLYTVNFAFLGLHEAAGVGDEPAKRAEDKLAGFLVRIQNRSEAQPSLDGGWFRAFDFKRWEAWASNADAGWGAWAIESGWTQGWITSVLGMRQMKTSLWGLVTKTGIAHDFDRLRRQMLPDEALQSLTPTTIQHEAVGKSVTLRTGPSASYPGGGPSGLTDGRLGGADHTDPDWLGFEGPDLEATIDLGAPTAIRKLSAGFLQSTSVGIYLPPRVEFDVSDDGVAFRPASRVQPAMTPDEAGPKRIVLSSATLDQRARYVRVHAVNFGQIPEGKPGAGAPAWLFVDEIIVNDAIADTKQGGASAVTNRYVGRFCEGEGDADFLRLIDESFAFFHPNPVVPNLTMLYQPDWDTFEEGAGWGAWWIQNSYGFSYAATPFLQEPWFSTLQRSWDLFWGLQGDGKRVGRPDYPLVAPDGCLGDCASPGSIAYKQGDGDWKIHDWFYEATAAGVVMQAEILLANRDRQAMARYLPKMRRACDFIEKARDSKNSLFLVGPACNLLAPSYGGVKQPDGSFGKGYLAGLSITYLAALDRMVELFKLANEPAQLAEYERRRDITRQSLPQLLTPEGYFVKSIEPGGIKHGVLGQKQFGYLEGVANADAVALRVADDETAARIYRQIASFPEIRPFDFLLVNAPGLDDTYQNWGGGKLSGFFVYGDWVNGGVWGTVEGRTILMYYRLGKFEDIRRSATRAMKWAKDFRMDAPWSQRGENTSNPWSDTGSFKVGGVAVMVDNFAIPAATIRGLFDYDYRADRLILRPRVPGCIRSYVQKTPVRFGEKAIFLSCRNDGPKVKSVTVNGKAVNVASPDAVDLLYDELPAVARVEIATEGGWPIEASTVPYAAIPALTVEEKGPTTPAPTELPESLKQPFAVLSAMKEALAGEPGADYERAFVSTAIESVEAYRTRVSMDPGPGYYRPITAERKAGINKFYERAALAMYRGLAKRMGEYAAKGDARQKHLAALFAKAQEAHASAALTPGTSASKPKPELSLTLIPPSPVTDRIELDIRGAVRNDGDTARTFDVAVYLDEAKPERRVHQEALTVAPQSAAGFKFRWPTHGHAGRHRMILTAQCGNATLRRERPIEILTSDVRSTRRLGGAWVDIYHHDEAEGKPFNAELGTMTDGNWRELVRAMHATDQNLLVITMMFQNFTHRSKHNFTPETYPGKAYYPSKLYPARMSIASADPLETIMDEADKLGMHVMPGIGNYAFFDYTPDSLRWCTNVADEIWERYGHHPSFYGWYLSHEQCGGLFTPNLGDPAVQRREMVEFFKAFTPHVKRLAPDKPVLLATNPYGLHGAEGTYRQLLPHVDILGPFGFHRMPEGDLSGEQAATLLQSLCDESGTHLWLDLETFVFENGAELHPRPLDGLISDFQRFPNFEKILHYQFPGMMSAPKMTRQPGGPASVKLYEDYRQYLMTMSSP